MVHNSKTQSFLHASLQAPCNTLCEMSCKTLFLRGKTLQDALQDALQDVVFTRENPARRKVEKRIFILAFFGFGTYVLQGFPL